MFWRVITFAAKIWQISYNFLINKFYRESLKLVHFLKDYWWGNTKFYPPLKLSGNHRFSDDFGGIEVSISLSISAGEMDWFKKHGLTSRKKTYFCKDCWCGKTRKHFDFSVCLVLIKVQPVLLQSTNINVRIISCVYFHPYFIV